MGLNAAVRVRHRAGAGEHVDDDHDPDQRHYRDRRTEKERYAHRQNSQQRDNGKHLFAGGFARRY